MALSKEIEKKRDGSFFNFFIHLQEMKMSSDNFTDMWYLSLVLTAAMTFIILGEEIGSPQIHYPPTAHFQC